MDKIIGLCGIPTFIATQNDDIEGLKEVAEKWSKEFKLNLTYKDVICDGCLDYGGRFSSYCKFCEIRKCGVEKKIPNCAYCTEYPCENLSRHFMLAPEAKAALEEIRKNI